MDRSSDNPGSHRLAPPLTTSAPTSANRSSAGDELIPGPAVPIEDWDPRAALLAVSVAQHTGRGTSPCLCPARPIAVTSPALRVDTEGVGYHEVEPQAWQDEARSFLQEGGTALRRRNPPRPDRAQGAGARP